MDFELISPIKQYSSGFQRIVLSWNSSYPRDVFQWRFPLLVSDRMDGCAFCQRGKKLNFVFTNKIFFESTGFPFRVILQYLLWHFISILEWLSKGSCGPDTETILNGTNCLNLVKIFVKHIFASDFLVNLSLFFTIFS